MPKDYIRNPATLEELSSPKEIDNVTKVFPANLDGLIPAWDDIPEEFKDPNSNHWALKLQSKWFFNGISTDDIPPPKEGISVEHALNHLGAIQGSFQPSHEHKAAAVGFLFTLWFNPPKKSNEIWDNFKSTFGS